MTQRTGESVLLSAKFSPSCYACVRSLRERGIDAVVASPYDDVPVFGSRYPEESVTVPAPDADLLAYKDALVSLARRPDVGTVIPIWEEDAYVLAKYGDEFADHVSGVWPSLDRLRNVQDRLRLAERAAEAGVTMPKTESFDEVDDWDRDLIVKSRYNLLADEYVDSMSASEAELNKSLTYPERDERPAPDEIYAEMNHVPIVQERVPGGNEYAFIALYDRGEPVFTYQKRQLRGKTYAGGTSVYRESVSVPELEAAGRRLLDHLDWHGLAEVEFLQNETTGEFELMEVNPRMWASLFCAVEAGANFPYYYWLAANGRIDGIDASYDTGTGNHSLFGELQYLGSVVSEDYPNVERPSLVSAAWEVASSCLDQPNFDYLHLDDPGPFVRGLWNELPVGR